MVEEGFDRRRSVASRPLPPSESSIIQPERIGPALGDETSVFPSVGWLHVAVEGFAMLGGGLGIEEAAHEAAAGVGE